MIRAMNREPSPDGRGETTQPRGPRSRGWEAVYGRPATDLEGFALETFHAALGSARKLKVWPDVAAEVLAEARRSYLAADEDDWLIAIADPAALGQGAHLGFAVTSRAIWWRNIGQPAGRAAFETMVGPELKGTWLEFGEAGSVDMQAVDGATIEALQAWCRTVAAAYRDGVPWDHVRGWYVRHKEEQRGPYTWRELDALLRSGALLPYTSEAYGPGLEDWTPMARIDEVAAILETLKSQEKPPEPARGAAQRASTSRPADEKVKIARPSRGEQTKPRSVGQVIDGVIDSVLKRLRR